MGIIGHRTNHACARVFLPRFRASERDFPGTFNCLIVAPASQASDKMREHKYLITCEVHLVQEQTLHLVVNGQNITIIGDINLAR